jgi:oxygen-dependent protoporphyrinogen oxidase
LNAGVLDLVVVGAGVAGLAAAVEARRRAGSVRLLDAGQSPGGVMQTVRTAGYCYERGPNAFRVHADATLWLAEQGLLDVLVPAGPEARKRALYLDGRLLWLPDSPLGLITTPLLSASGKLRAIGELFRRAGDGDAECVADFITRRFGPELLARAIAPFLVGVYAGDERELGARAVFPTLVEWEANYGSVLRGSLHALFSRSAKGLAGSQSCEGGVQAFATRLAKSLEGVLTLGTPVKSVTRAEKTYRLVTERETLLARRIVLATPAGSAAELLQPLDPEAADRLRAVEYAPLASVALGLDPAQVDETIRGFGYLVPKQAGIKLLGTLFPSRVFSGRAPPGRELAMAMVGGRRWPEVVQAKEGAILREVEDGLAKTLGARDSGQVLGINRWECAVPQPGPNHVEEIRALREQIGKHLPGVSLAGSYLDGVSVADTLMCGVRAVRSGHIAEPSS